MAKFLALPFMAFMATSLSANAETGPVWDRYSSLICRDETVTICRAAGQTCERTAGKAIFTFDFKTSISRSFGVADPGTIESRVYDGVPTLLDEPDAGTIFLSWGIVVTFGQPKRGQVAGESDDILAVAEQATGGDVYIRRMKCHPT